ncbi:MAG: FHA domain-containing protein [Verrucomicrobiota bacterium]
MVQLTVLSGKTAGALVVARRFPFRIGRAPDDNLRIEEAGIWDGHLELSLKMPAGLLITVHEKALAAANGEPFKQRIVRNGDVIEIGSARIQLALSPTQQRGFRARELVTWAALIGLFGFQGYVIYWLSVTV